MTETLWFKKQIQNQNLIEKLKKIKLVVTDVDGCLTDGTVAIGEDGKEYKSFSIQDGFGTKLLQSAGITCAFLSGRNNHSTHIRAQKLGIPDNLCFTGKGDEKLTTLEKIKKQTSVKIAEVCFFGDDLLDSNLKNHVGIFAAPANALFYVKHVTDITVPKNGGVNAFRLLLDLILYVQKKHPAQNLIDEALSC